MSLGVNDYPYRGRCPGACQTGCTCGINNFACCQCTSFACWRALNDLGSSAIDHSFGDGGSWAGAARAKGILVDGNPTRGSIICLTPGVNGASSAGHVGIVLGVSGRSAIVEDYNWTSCGYNGGHPIPIAGSQFIHLGALSGGGTPCPSGCTGTVPNCTCPPPPLHCPPGWTVSGQACIPPPGWGAGIAGAALPAVLILGGAGLLGYYELQRRGLSPAVLLREGRRPGSYGFVGRPAPPAARPTRAQRRGPARMAPRGGFG